MCYSVSHFYLIKMCIDKHTYQRHYILYFLPPSLHVCRSKDVIFATYQAQTERSWSAPGEPLGWWFPGTTLLLFHRLSNLGSTPQAYKPCNMFINTHFKWTEMLFCCAKECYSWYMTCVYACGTTFHHSLTLETEECPLGRVKIH